MRHDLFEKCITYNNYTTEFVRQHAPNIVRDHAEQLIGCGIYNEHECIMDVIKIQPQIQKFAQMYTDFCQNDGNANQNKPFKELVGHAMSPGINFVAKAVEDTEEGAFSTELGLKGYVDATMRVKTKGCAVQRTMYGNEQPSPPQTTLMGIELKTGHSQKANMNHVAQLSLYTLMLRARYGSSLSTQRSISQNGAIDMSENFGAVNGGMLLYLNHEAFNAQHVSPAMNEVKSLISQRNTVAAEIKRAAKPRGITISYEEDSEENTGQLKKR